jgi:hypothetical protein
VCKSDREKYTSQWNKYTRSCYEGNYPTQKYTGNGLIHIFERELMSIS